MEAGIYLHRDKGVAPTDFWVFVYERVLCMTVASDKYSVFTSYSPLSVHIDNDILTEAKQVLASNRVPFCKLIDVNIVTLGYTP